MPDIYGAVFYGNFCEIEEIIKNIPQFQKKLNLSPGEDKDLMQLRISEWISNAEPKDKEIQVRSKIGNKFETITLKINVLAAIDGDMRLYFGLDLGHCEFREDFRIREILFPTNRQIKVCERIFEKYQLGVPRLYLIQAMA